ncbi:carcinoembryonic antigen-related cell adhesion molecule 5-like [Oncorhynchus kisutch]|uniref:carcinoembryonic antigen-related cell adhesion molecule 5-like n=1 Tax=Oncorhynchus kisutch TaxID=8019 RepID=UPI0012DD8A8A|nr:carcinoembryonic antigen-related cell adhesion molecule 5-like [Oncorhynchus kisutch]
MEPLSLYISVSATVNMLNTTSSFLIGSTLTMSCSAQSNPQAEFQWTFNGKHLKWTSLDLKLYSAVESQSGLCSCLAFNNRTMSYSNITRQITISSGSVSEQLGVSVWLLLLSSLAGVLF